MEIINMLKQMKNGVKYIVGDEAFKVYNLIVLILVTVLKKILSEKSKSDKDQHNNDEIILDAFGFIKNDLQDKYYYAKYGDILIIVVLEKGIKKIKNIYFKDIDDKKGKISKAFDTDDDITKIAEIYEKLLSKKDLYLKPLIEIIRGTK